MDHENKSHKTPNSLFPWWFGVVALVITLVWYFGPQIVSWHRGHPPQLSPNEFGDQFGSINTLFSGLAFLGVLAGIFIQGKEFRHQLLEMRASAQEMEKQTQIYDAQLVELKTQNQTLLNQVRNTDFRQAMSDLPFFVITKDHGSAHVKLENKGASVFSVRIESTHFVPPTEPIIWVSYFGSSSDEPYVPGQPRSYVSTFKVDPGGLKVEMSITYFMKSGIQMVESITQTLRYASSSREDQVQQLRSKMALTTSA